MQTAPCGCDYAEVPGNTLLNVSDHALEAALWQALDRDEFSLVYQPRVSMHTGLVTGVEALIRWHSATYGPITPISFIPFAEAHSLIVPIGLWALERACADFRRSLAGTHANRSLDLAHIPQLSVNISVPQLESPHFIADMESVLARYNIAPGELELELTESVRLHDSPASQAVLQQLQQLGISLAMDDFGTGYATMRYLTHFHFNRLKIDQSFIRGMEHDPTRNAICRAVIQLGKELRIPVVAEGIECSQHLSMLRELGCDEGQGYYFARPVAIDHLATTIHRIEHDAHIPVI